MNSSDLSFSSLNMILSDIATKSGDREFKYESEGYYTGLIQEALQELSFDTFFLEKEKVYELSDGCLILKMPIGYFNVKEIFGYTGSDCNPQNAKNIWWKDNYKNKLARDNYQNNGDPFFKNRGQSSPPGNLYFCGIVNGEIHLSESCKSFSKVVVRANGLITDVGETPIIPMFFRQAVTDYCVVEALSTRIAGNTHMTKEVAYWQSIMNRHDERLTRDYDGSWWKARNRVKIMDKKSKEDLKEYFSRLDY